MGRGAPAEERCKWPARWESDAREHQGEEGGFGWQGEVLVWTFSIEYHLEWSRRHIFCVILLRWPRPASLWGHCPPINVLLTFQTPNSIPPSKPWSNLFSWTVAPEITQQVPFSHLEIPREATLVHDRLRPFFSQCYLLAWCNRKGSREVWCFQIWVREKTIAGMKSYPCINVAKEPPDQKTWLISLTTNLQDHLHGTLFMTAQCSTEPPSWLSSLEPLTISYVLDSS